MEPVYLEQEARTGKMKVLTVWTEGDTIHREWGQRDGKMQTSEKRVTGKNLGKSNATTPGEQAVLDAQRIIDKKRENGYTTVGTVQAVHNNDPSEPEFFNDLPSTFAPSKPIIKPPTWWKPAMPNIAEWCAERKNNGVNLLCVVGSDGIKRTYTRGIKNITNVITGAVGVIEDFLALDMPNETIFSYELIHYTPAGIEEPRYLRGVVNDRTSSEKAAVRYDELLENGSTFAIRVFDVLFYDGEDTTAMDYIDRRALLTKAIWGEHPEYASTYYPRITQGIIDRGKKKKWEGFVLRPLKGPESHVEYTLNGKPGRKGVYKLVFVYTTDVVITEAKIGDSGRLLGLPARFHLAQYDTDGELVDCGWAGPGHLTTAELPELADTLGLTYGEELAGITRPVPNLTAAQITYRTRQEGSNYFEFPVIDAIRQDKPINECLLTD